ncbi:integrase family protein [Desulfitobacterium hafniense DCB-2]|uniref:Integrase family protein n=1 Tax=Desulfitobacterium hafniense (strain DSM 10664 / DCB-2) TaxID=272564 RepID=B8FNW8_DESHD|nr:tyrosine-type recombinase/integrase [Desulfitobacterium hafniense]ACL19493.1 integrase family protein [Desulfitobacterium hafniense DCB-2]
MQTKKGLEKMIMSKGEDITFTELQKRYLKKCLVNNLSEYTLRFYEVSCNTFNKFIDLSQLMASEVNRDLIDNYILYLRNTGVKAVTINTYIHGISPIIKYGMSLGLIEKFGFNEIKTTEEIKQIYTPHELQILLKKPNMKSFAEYRNWVIINFLLGTGVRALELRSIRIKDIDLKMSMLIVPRTKNGKQRYIPISKSLNKILTDYLDYRKAESEEDFLFCNEFGQYLPRTTLQIGITKYCKKRGVNKYSLHLFRHTFANMWIVNNGSLFILQKILGHASLKQVNHYANLAMGDLKQNFDSFCALESVAVQDKNRIKM